MSLEGGELERGNDADAMPKSGGKSRLLSLADLDQRTRAYQRTRDLIEEIEADLGGAAQLSVGARQLIQRAAVTGALLEDQEARWLAGEAIDPALYATLGNAQRRLFESVGLRRVPRDVTPSLKDYLAQRRPETAGAGAT